MKRNEKDRLPYADTVYIYLYCNSHHSAYYIMDLYLLWHLFFPCVHLPLEAQELRELPVSPDDLGDLLHPVHPVIREKWKYAVCSIYVRVDNNKPVLLQLLHYPVLLGIQEARDGQKLQLLLASHLLQLVPDYKQMPERVIKNT